ncbi:MAG: hypothetical protein JWP37_451 [Mucilaginibacter sp.]|nr:hypothetical protein [Mucilaginibacter sp.]
MKRLLPGSILIGCLVCLSSCTKVLYTHQQVLQNCHTKDDVVKKFGSPDEKNMGDGIEEWVYNRDAPADIVKPIKPDIINASYKSSDSLHLKKPIEHDKYIRFIFDTQGNVVGYKSNGIGLTQKGKDGIGISILKILGATVLIAVVVGLDVASKSDIDF